VPETADENAPYVELAVMKSPDNPSAVWLWQPVEHIIGKELKVRVGGSFVWPPPGIEMSQINRAVFIAGGVGIKCVHRVFVRLIDRALLMLATAL
jgi:hypothetical protein